MAGPAPPTLSCGDAVQALLAGRWNAWHGLAGDCSLASIARDMGGADVLDANAWLGSEAVPCTRSSLGGAPVLVWHRQDRLLLIECDLVGTPRDPPSLGGTAVHRLDIHWGAALLEGGEAVIPDRGLALILTGGDRVVACRGFPPMSLDDYVATHRPRSEAMKPFRPLPPRGIEP